MRDQTTDRRSLYEKIVAAGIPIDNHESDLYVLATPEARAIIKAHEPKVSSATLFVSQIDNRLWFDVPFHFDPFWQRRAADKDQACRYCGSRVLVHGCERTCRACSHVIACHLDPGTVPTPEAVRAAVCSCHDAGGGA